MRRVLRCLMVLVVLAPPTLAAGAGQPCEVIPMPCTFEGAPFKLVVVDAETRQPLANVHALAEWQTFGPGARRNGPLMALDAASGSDGVVAFRVWGPIKGPWLGLAIGSDPIVTLFTSGYKTLVVNNGYLPPGRERERVRRFAQDGWTYALEPFRGTQDEWVEELRKASQPQASPVSDEVLLQFRDAYLNRLRRVWAERDRLPERFRARGQLFWSLEGTRDVLEKGHR